MTYMVYGNDKNIIKSSFSKSVEYKGLIQNIMEFYKHKLYKHKLNLGLI